MGVGRKAVSYTVPVICILSFISFHSCTAKEIIRDPGTITSSGGAFSIGFFSLGTSSKRYIGIWHTKFPHEKVVWVANRNNPVIDSSGVLVIGKDRNLAVLDGKNNILWSTNVSNINYNTTAELLDNGNLVLQEEKSNGTYLWESFKHLTDTILPTMKANLNTKSEANTQTSWKSLSDPSIGNFVSGIEPSKTPQIVVYNGSKRHWRSGPWNNQIFIGIPDMNSLYFNGFNLLRDGDGEGSMYLTFYRATSKTETFYLDSEGNVRGEKADDTGNKWIKDMWQAPRNKCDFYGTCGGNGICNMLTSPICHCLKGYQPKSIREWTAGNWSAGCVRKTQLRCERNRTNSEKIKYVFMKLKNMKVPDFPNWISANKPELCEQECLQNCSCVAYSFVTGTGCMLWNDDLVDLQKFTTAGVDFNLRVADKKKYSTVSIIAEAIAGLVSFAISGYLLWYWISKKRGSKTSVDLAECSTLGENSELPNLSFEKLSVATNKFIIENKLGEGGFGSVYKGIFLDGQEIAVKRLSKSSGQGTQEFKNEVRVISKLQHRNLVKLLGCCTEGEEKMLVYEYMTNKSLDAFLFDPKKRALLDWGKRSIIIEGICRGTLYLHRDSRLKVIHRDLKASNILLDKELNPKISDFGMARIFGGNEKQANTIRVVGTYGYMSPEYAMEGIFSEKSDVFSLGVLLLEIVSGKRNSGFFTEQSSSLLGHAWKLWNEDNVQLFIDRVILEKDSLNEILRCIHVGMLCVQELPRDRPTVSVVLSMLTSEIANLPTPKQPGFTLRHLYSDSDLSGKRHEDCSINNGSISSVLGR